MQISCRTLWSQPISRLAVRHTWHASRLPVNLYGCVCGGRGPFAATGRCGHQEQMGKASALTEVDDPVTRALAKGSKTDSMLTSSPNVQALTGKRVINATCKQQSMDGRCLVQVLLAGAEQQYPGPVVVQITWPVLKGKLGLAKSTCQSLCRVHHTV